MKKVNTISYPTDEVFAAACAALRINEVYLKDDLALYDKYGCWVRTDKLANKMLVRKLLDGVTEFGTITDEDREHGIAVRRYYTGLTFKILAGTKLSDFDQSALRVATEETLSSGLDIGVTAYLPTGYARYKDRATVAQRLATAQGYVAQIGDKVKGEIEVVKSYYHRDWKISYITGLTDENKAVFFSYREDIEVGARITVSGRVKDTRNDSYEVTQLTRVRVH